MNTNSNRSMETVLKEIIRLRGLAVLSDGRVLTSIYCDLSSEKKDQRLLRYFVESGGHTALLEAKNMSPAMQKACFNQVVIKMCTETLVSEEAAKQVCNAFWSAVYGRPMEETAVQFQQEQKLPSQNTQKSQNIQQQVQRIQQKPKPTPSVQPVPQKQNDPVCKKKDFYITKKEYYNGGNIAVYYGDGTKQIINFPPIAKNRQRGLPTAIHPGSGVDGQKQDKLINYSDERLRNYVSYGYLTDTITAAACIVLPSIGWYVLASLLIPTVSYVADWIMKTLFNFDLIKGIVISGFSFTQLFELIKICLVKGFSFELNNFWSWLVVAYIGLLLVLIFWEFKLNLEKRISVRAEVERRKRL